MPHSRRQLVVVRTHGDLLVSLHCIDVLLLRFPRPHLGDPEPRTRMRANPKQNVDDHGGDLVPVAARARICTLHANHLPNRGAAHGRPLLAPRARVGVVLTA